MSATTRRGPRIAIAGAVAQRPGQGGHTWVFLQFVLGFRRLGWDVLLIDRIEPGMCVDAAGAPCAVERSVNVAYMRDILARFDCADAYVLLHDRGRDVFWSTRERVTEHVRESVALIDVMGYLDDVELLGVARRRVFFDIDPGFSHMWHDLGWSRLFDGYETFVTVAGNIGRSDCAIPTCDRTWIPTLQPIVLEHWPASPATGGLRFTSVGAWRGPYAPIEYAGTTYGLRVHEFRRFIELPMLTGRRFEVALDIHAAETEDIARLAANRWTIIDPETVAGDPHRYRTFIADSSAELMIAKHMYVATRSGWFSDRSVCYLASGRPVIAQDTGFGDSLPTGLGLLGFGTLDEAASAVESVTTEYHAHARAARMIAEEYFDSDRVLRSLLARLGVE